MNPSSPPSSLPLAQRLALDLSAERQRVAQAQQRVEMLLGEVDGLNAEIDRLRGSVRLEADSRLQAEGALSDTRDRLQLAVGAADLALWEWELSSSEVRLSARWGEMLGDVAVEGYWDIGDLAQRVHPEDMERVRAEFLALLKQQGVRRVAQYRVRVFGGWLWIESHAMVAERDSQGRALRLMGTHADISERKRVEDAVMQALALAEQASRAKSEFLANISHEVRTPLNAIMGLIRLLMESPVDAEQKHWLELMNGSSHTLLGLLNDVLDLSRIESGKLQIEDRPFNLLDELKGQRALYLAQAQAKGLACTLDMDPALPERLWGDAARLRQVVGNLLSNAVKFTPGGGRIELSARWLDRGAASAPEWQLQVRDTGMGIAADKHATIFDAFTQADTSTTRRFGGSGLGLAICARLVRLMGGRIDLQSAPGEGSCFTVTLPLRTVGLQAVSPPAEAAALASEPSVFEQRFAGLRVLVAEDHPVNELLMTRLLRRMGSTVVVARNGDEAVAAWEQGGFDLVLMDVQMPGTNGQEATLRIRALETARGLPRTPVVAVTASAMQGDKDLFLGTGFDSYASKPLVVPELVQAMEDALEGCAPAGAQPVSAAASPVPGAVGVEPSALAALWGPQPADLAGFAQRLEARMAEELDMLRLAHAAQSLTQVRDAMHSLANSLGLLPAERALRLCKGLELAARSGDWALYGRALPLLESEVRALLARAFAGA
jgi:signal transduction histidine kinase/CheY-like chemotaxis protein/HPt (histidine-containing phosphotransfer) domain-containing protein